MAEKRNCKGRIYTEQGRQAAEAAYKKAYDDWVEAKNREVRAKNLDRAEQEFQDQIQASHDVKNRINMTVDDVASRNQLYSGVHDAVDGAAAVGGFYPGFGGMIADGTSIANNIARDLTRSPLYGILPTQGGPSTLANALDNTGFGFDLAGVGTSAFERAAIETALAVGDYGAAVGAANRGAAAAAAAFGPGTNIAGAFVYTAQVLERGSFYTAVYQFQDIVNLSPNELRALADQIDSSFRPGIIDEALEKVMARFNKVFGLPPGTDPRYLSSDLRELASRKETLGKAADQLKDVRAHDPNVSVEEAEKETAEKAKQLQEAEAARDAARAGMRVVPVE